MGTAASSAVTTGALAPAATLHAVDVQRVSTRALASQHSEQSTCCGKPGISDLPAQPRHLMPLPARCCIAWGANCQSAGCRAVWPARRPLVLLPAVPQRTHCSCAAQMPVRGEEWVELAWNSCWALHQCAGGWVTCWHVASHARMLQVPQGCHRCVCHLGALGSRLPVASTAPTNSAPRWQAPRQPAVPLSALPRSSRERR